MGKHFHNMKPRVVGFVEYNLSPFEQRAFAGVLKEGIGNTAVRYAKSFWLVIRKCWTFGGHT